MKKNPKSDEFSQHTNKQINEGKQKLKNNEISILCKILY